MSAVCACACVWVSCARLCVWCVRVAVCGCACARGACVWRVAVHTWFHTILAAYLTERSPPSNPEAAHTYQGALAVAAA